MLLFTSDNGPEVGQPGVTRGLIGRKRDLTEGGIRMPTVLEWPKQIGRNFNLTDWPAVSNDILPTVMDALGVKSTTNWPLDGISLLPLLAELAQLQPTGAAGEPPQESLVVTSAMISPRSSPIGHATGQPGDAFKSGLFNESGVVGPAPHRVTHDLMQKQFAWTVGHMKLWVHYETPPPSAGAFTPVLEQGQSIHGADTAAIDAAPQAYVYRLFNITADRFENHDLSASAAHAGMFHSMQTDLMAWYKSVLNSSSSLENNCRANQNKPTPAPGPPTPQRHRRHPDHLRHCHLLGGFS
jgi:hypothetical protein